MSLATPKSLSNKSMCPILNMPVFMLSGMPRSTVNSDHLGIFLHIVLIVYTTAPWLCVAFVLALDIKLDPIFLSIKYCMPKYWNQSLMQAYYLIRPLIIVPSIQICRTLCCVILTGIIICHLYLNTIENLNKKAFRVANHFRSGVEKYFRDYNSLRILAVIISEAFGGIILFSLTSVFILTVDCNYASIRLRDEIPMTTYIFFPVT